MLTVLIIMTYKPTPITKIEKLLMLKRHPTFLTIFKNNFTAPTKWFWNINLDSNTHKVTPIVSFLNWVETTVSTVFPTSSAISIFNLFIGKPSSWIQNRVWEKLIFCVDELFSRRLNKTKCLSKLQGSFINTRSTSMLVWKTKSTTWLPTSRILNSFRDF